MYVLACTYENTTFKPFDQLACDIMSRPYFIAPATPDACVFQAIEKEFQAIEKELQAT